MKKMLCLLVALTVLGSSALFADWYVPLNQVPQAVLATHYNVYKVKMSNMMELYIDKSGNLLGQEWDD